ncbi:NADPH-dependent F420 reductase [Paenibacillus mucilaginosus]|uniref:NADP oxidoreductase, coenzyme F420-dependent n=2 Tax=Paenibacillus mucilaginosus TaxID=61624 RepID=H6NJQ8_9BACL|nr:NAD(P)-binding domain-containing protein [Paenibacillus mucilaginosus]AEI41701.1 NADP oxidoreductase, coenzyme F420-dependent [Paenibacillus mucilaginosus KNP414]AFC30212.1 NADP oxidoreductase, coenzyme F420-dependent [Paenibacillus mucilaginosus 3016]MCG7214394.1 NAD(P)-binding domain-containing protein [Paenibacillus mucilaginosus]WDM30680.1 NAD(P)-binding domain-containing protein [Paenibacillus mucilaginosus]WFA18858.1 NADP oxidoreductase [Paenibacillus mucilaginosus]
MKIAAIGSGNMGGTLGKRWAALGHQVMFGSRDPHSQKIKLLLQDAGTNAQAGTIREAAAFGEVILLAVLPDDVERVLAEAGDLKGKILINCTNRYDGKSADAEVRRLAPNAHVVRAFHTLPWEVLADPRYDAGTAAAFLSGDDPAATATVAHLISEMGLDPVEVGVPDGMAQVETAVGTLWSVLAPRFGREYSLSVLRR